MFSIPARCPIFFLVLLVTNKAFLKVIFVSYVTKVASSKGLTSEALQKQIRPGTTVRSSTYMNTSFTNEHFEKLSGRTPLQLDERTLRQQLDERTLRVQLDESPTAARRTPELDERTLQQQLDEQTQQHKERPWQLQG